MGIILKELNKLLEAANKVLEIKTICEFGNQHIRKDIATYLFTAKEYLVNSGYDHTSIDINEKDGALKRNLSFPIKDLGKFDMVTNFGTLEHVKGQNNGFRNLHNLCKKDGLIVNCFPIEWVNHGVYYYTKGFIEYYKNKCGCDILFDIKVPRKKYKSNIVMMQKKSDLKISKKYFDKYSEEHLQSKLWK